MGIAADSWTDISDCHVPRRAGGICYSPYEEDIFIGGGIDDQSAHNSVEMYHSKVDKWTKLPDTNQQHKLHPVMWVEDGSMLYIASILQRKEVNSCEVIDLRVAKEWTYVVKTDLLGAVFGIDQNLDADNL